MNGGLEIGSDLGLDMSTMVVKGAQLDKGDMRKKLWCDHCKKFWHTRDTCWKIHNKLNGWKQKSERALQIMAKSSQVFTRISQLWDAVIHKGTIRVACKNPPTLKNLCF